MESRQRDRVSVGKAAAVVADRGRVYSTKKGYASLVVFTKELMTLDLLERSFGGAHYVHRSGYIWVLSNRGLLKTLVADLEEHGDPLGAVRTKILSLL